MGADQRNAAPVATKNLAMVFATFNRPHTVQRLINSVREYFPDMPIYVADQSDPSDKMRAYYELHGCKVVWMENDAGVCASRNAAVDLVTEPYFLLCDDDFYFGPETNFDAALTLLRDQPDIGIVGGRLLDVHEHEHGSSVENRFWELFFSYDKDKGKLVTIPVHYFAPDPKYAQGVEYFECDAVMNFAVFRRGMIDAQIRWDPQFKSNGEHEDFYLNLKMNGQYRVVYTPSIVAYHHHPLQPNYQKLRRRSRGWQKFLDKWQLKQFLEMDLGLRITNRVENLLPYAIGYQSYYEGIPLETRPSKAFAGCLQLSNVTGRVLPTKSKIDGRGEAAVTGHLQIGRDGTGICTGGSWAKRVQPARAQQVQVSQDAGAIDFELQCPESYENGVDTVCYLWPKLENAGIQEITGVEVYYSVVIGADYVVFLQPALPLGQKVFSNQWNALVINLPAMKTALHLEVVVLKDGKHLFSTTSAEIACIKAKQRLL
jgi:glycosyltransferase involved in cell wall biosynthesis